jgi:hypothetical protein
METTVGKYTFKITQDSDSETSREWCNLAKMIFVGNYRNLGDSHEIDFSGGFSSRNDFIEEGEAIVRKALKDVAIIKAVHCYKHSGTSISTTYGGSFACRFDSGTIGFAVITKEAIRKNWNIVPPTDLSILEKGIYLERETKKYLEQADTQLEGEIKSLGQFISGEIYRYEVIDNELEDSVDSCGGFYGYDWTTNGITDYIFQEVELTEEQKVQVLKNLA